MANLNFNLRKKESDTPTPINLVIRWNNQRLVYPTYEKIHPDFWNFGKQRAKETKKFPEYPEFNYRLDNIKKQANNVFRTFLNDHNSQPPTPKELKSELDKVFKREVTEKDVTLLSFIDTFINDSQKIRSPKTIEVYKTTLKHLKGYILFKRLKTLNFENIDLDFYTNFVEYLSKHLNLSYNSVGKYIKTLKTFMGEATERNYNTNLAFKSMKFKTYQKPTDQIYLTEKELTAIYELDLSNNKRLEKARDLFIVGCYTALRFSDFSRIKTENIIETENGNILKFRTQKTDEVVYIPIHYRVQEIIKKYENKLPPAISNQKMNKYIKEVGELAGINDEVTQQEKRGNLQFTTTVKKYELITTHTARRSGATNMFKSGIPTINIMKITGHKTEKAFMQYIRISQEENAEMLLNHNFFKKTIQIAK